MFYEYDLQGYASRYTELACREARTVPGENVGENTRTICENYALYHAQFLQSVFSSDRFLTYSNLKL